MNFSTASRVHLQPLWHITIQLMEALTEAVVETRGFSDLQTREVYQLYRPGDSEGYCYAECGYRFMLFLTPERFDAWGLDDFGGRWDYGFCVMDDFGNAVRADAFNHYAEGYQSVLAPDYANPPAQVGDVYPYVVLHETVH